MPTVYYTDKGKACTWSCFSEANAQTFAAKVGGSLTPPVEKRVRKPRTQKEKKSC